MSALIQGRDLANRWAHNQRAWLVWHFAALSRMKKLPPLQKLQVGNKRQAQTWQEQYQIFEMIARAHNQGLAKRLAKQGG